jgi:hypothetical protein
MCSRPHRFPIRLAIASLLLATGALTGCTRSQRSAEPAAGRDSAAGEEVAGGDDPVICEKVEVPGRRVRKRVCRRESEIRAEREASQSGVRGVRPEPPPVPEYGSGM